MDLQILAPGMIALPAQLAASSLTYAEIGLIFCLQAMQEEAGRSPEAMARFAGPDSQALIETLQARGVIQIATRDNTMHLTISLDAACGTPAGEPEEDEETEEEGD